jgi:hypothetical protein
MDPRLDPIVLQNWHDTSVALIEELMKIPLPDGTPEAQLLDKLADAVVVYERVAFPFDEPSPEELEAFLREQ